ncbi:Uncharacterised protein [Mycobacteroides abscessus subsp. abscessus]|nr:Uncharacterised protein [Mycobacteroides abscessus subsp. abscessus]
MISSMIMMTAPVTPIMISMLLSAASFISAAGPVTYTVTPCGGVELSTISLTATTDLLPKVLPWSPARLTCT